MSFLFFVGFFVCFRIDWSWHKLLPVSRHIDSNRIDSDLTKKMDSTSETVIEPPALSLIYSFRNVGHFGNFRYFFFSRKKKNIKSKMKSASSGPFDWFVPFRKAEQLLSFMSSPVVEQQWITHIHYWIDQCQSCQFIIISFS